MDRADSRLRSADHQTWLVDVGHALIEKKRSDGIDALTPRERLILCVWIADHSMRTEGDLTTARALDPAALVDARDAATILDLPRTAAAFGLTEGAFERCYFDLFDAICAELRAR